jgi:hypothetical protein
VSQAWILEIALLSLQGKPKKRHHRIAMMFAASMGFQIEIFVVHCVAPRNRPLANFNWVWMMGL